MTCTLRRQSLRGFTRSEAIVLLALLGIVALFAVTYQRSLSRRERLLRDVRGVQFLLIAARQDAMQRSQQVVSWIDLKDRRIVTWADQVPNLVQDPGEPTIGEYRISPDLFFRYAPSGEPANGPAAVSFDGYLGNPALVDRIVFRANGTLVAPGEPECRPPRAPRRFSATVPAGSMDCNPGNRCRGIFLTDTASGSSRLNAFRVSADDPGQTGTVTILKWLPASEGGNAGETDYVPPPWKWVD